jgi:hypothetical protein
MSRTILRWLALGCTVIPLSAGLAHAFELYNKMMLDGPLWLAVQQHLYRGWGPLIAPFEIAAIVSAWTLAVLERDRQRIFRLTMVAAVSLTTMLAVFFAVVEPVNIAFAQWTASTLPADWPAYRWRWEVGHLVHSALAFIAVAALLRAAYLDSVEAAVRTPRHRHGPAPRVIAPRPQRRHIERPVRAGNAAHNVVPLHYRDRLR